MLKTLQGVEQTQAVRRQTGNVGHREPVMRQAGEAVRRRDRRRRHGAVHVWRWRQMRWASAPDGAARSSTDVQGHGTRTRTPRRQICVNVAT